MISRPVWVPLAVATLLACGNARRSKREIVLEKLPAGVTAVIVAEGATLAHARARRVIDVLRTELPSSLGCAIDVALGGDQVALGIGADRSFTLVVATRAEVDCATLSQIERGIWVATQGGGVVAAADGALPVLADATFERARPYLSRAPIAFAMAFQGGELIGTAQTEPLEAWLAFDTSAELAPALEKELRARLARMGSEATTSPLAARISLVREGPQVVGRLARGDDGEVDLAAAVRTIRDWSRPAPVAPAPGPVAGLACPAPIDPIVSCAELPGSEPLRGIVLTARSAKAAVALVTTSRCSPVITNQTVRGLRLEVDIPALGLVTGDILFGSAGRLVTSKAVLVETLAREAASGETSLTVRRGILERVIYIRRIREPKKE